MRNLHENSIENSVSHQRSGIALVTVLIAAVVAILILNIMNISLIGELKGSRSSKVRNEMVQAADGVSEQARLDLVRQYKDSLLTPRNFIAGLNTTPRAAIKLGPGLSGAWNIGERSNSTDGFGWVKVLATVQRGDETQTVVRTVAFSRPDVFNLAMLAENVNCMFCHLRVNGDVGSLGTLRPGWGTEGGEGECSGNDDGGSTVKGSVYSSVQVSRDCTELTGAEKKINGTIVIGNINENTTTNLPIDALTDKASFPAITRAVASRNANGSLSGGTIIKVPKGSSLTEGTLAAGGSSPVDKTTPNNVVLIGTDANPIILDRDVYIQGDVVIKGVIKGRGGIYAERNIYVAGDLLSANPPDSTGAGVCLGLRKGVVADEEECARKNIEAGRDELRLAARGSIIMGDYTERDASGNLVPVNKLQSADYYRDQFGFDGQTHYYDSTNGDELTCQGSNTSKCVNVEGKTVPSGNVIGRVADRDGLVSQDAYSYSFRPGSIDAAQNFQSWINDALYREQVLGSKSYAYNTWRVDLGDMDNDQREELLEKAGLSSQTVAAVIAALKDNDEGDILDDNGNVIGYFNNAYDKLVKFVFDGVRSYENQITQVAAFLYSNRRIAGKTSMLGLNISGGMITREMGVLVPGRLWNDWMTVARYDFLKDPDATASDCGEEGDAYYVAGTEHCALTVNYDYRLRTGGYGFNLVEAKPGQTLAWRLSDSKTERAMP